VGPGNGTQPRGQFLSAATSEVPSRDGSGVGVSGGVGSSSTSPSTGVPSRAALAAASNARRLMSSSRTSSPTGGQQTRLHHRRRVPSTHAVRPGLGDADEHVVGHHPTALEDFGYLGLGLPGQLRDLSLTDASLGEQPVDGGDVALG
jgi:hypothetical protein